jgi:phosphinothricin acetyltransferase
MQPDLARSGDEGHRKTCSTPGVRQARRGDAAAIAAIYNQAILARTSTFETAPHTKAQIEVALAERGERYPTLVVEHEGRIVAWAASSPYSTRACFAGIAECSIYVDRAARGSGVGRMAMQALIRECEGRGFWKLLGRIFAENTASRALARSLGFREVGVLMCHALLDGRWRDAVIVERLLGAAGGRACLEAVALRGDDERGSH